MKKKQIEEVAEVKSPPAVRLVGIELNPGPMKAETAQNIFRDGLHVIYTFLTDSEWLNAAITCNYWYSCARSDPRRLFVIAHPHPLSYVEKFYTSIFRTRVIEVHLPRQLINMAQLTLLISFFTQLRVCEVIIADRTLDGATFDEGMRTMFSSCHFLRELIIHDDFISKEALLHLLYQLPEQLETLAVYSSAMQPCALSGLHDDCPSLTSLTLHCHSASVGALDNFISDTLLEMKHLTSLDINEGQYVQQLIAALQLEEVEMPSLQKLNIAGYASQRVILHSLAKLTPSLTELTRSAIRPYGSVSELSLLSQFKSLKSFSFPSDPYVSSSTAFWKIGHQHQLSALAACPQLTHLHLARDFLFDTQENWTSLFSSLPFLLSLSLLGVFDHSHLLPHAHRLHHITFEETHFLIDVLSTLGAMTNLKSIRFIGMETFSLDVDFDDLKEGMIHSLFLPQISQFKVYHYEENVIMRGIVGQVALTPHAPRLVGIELNPGPLIIMSSSSQSSQSSPPPPPPSPPPPPPPPTTTTTTTTMQLQRFFKDGISSIIQFLSHRDWMSASCTCHHWLSVAEQRNYKRHNRQITLSLSALTYQILRPLFRSSLRHHVTSISLLIRHRSYHKFYLTLRQLNTIMRNLSHLTQFAANLIPGDQDGLWKRKVEKKQQQKRREVERQMKKEKTKGDTRERNNIDIDTNDTNDSDTDTVSATTESTTISTSSPTWQCWHTSFSSRLTHLKLHFEDQSATLSLPALNRILMDLVDSCHDSLIHLELSNLSNTTRLTPLTQCQNLTSLILRKNLAKIQPKDCMDFMTDLSNMSSKLTSLRIYHFGLSTEDVTSLYDTYIRLPRIRHFWISLTRSFLNTVGFEQLFKILPNVEDLETFVVDGKLLPILLLVKHSLTAVGISVNPIHAIDTLNQLTHLQSLNFEWCSFGTILRGSSSNVRKTTSPTLDISDDIISTACWSQLAQTVPYLTSLTFTMASWQNKNDPERVIVPLAHSILARRLIKLRIFHMYIYTMEELNLVDSHFTSLKVFECFKGSFHPEKFSYESLYEKFDDIDFIPTLERLEFHHIVKDKETEKSLEKSVVWDTTKAINLVHFRAGPRMKKIVQTMPPATRLVGIELNPGPPSTNMNAQTLFVDGLHSIFAFLSNRDFLLAVTGVCKSWYSVSGSSSYPCRSFSANSHQANSLPAGTRSALRRHLTRVDVRFGLEPTVIQDSNRLIQSLPFYSSLRSLTFHNFPVDTDLTPLLKCHSLFSYSLVHFSFAHPSNLSVDQFVMQMRILSRLPHLSSLSLTKEEFNEWNDSEEMISILAKNDITFHSVTNYSPQFAILGKPTFVMNLVKVFPQLTEVRTYTFDHESLQQLSSLTNVRSMLLRSETESDEIADESDIIKLLSTRFTQLTHLAFIQWCPSSNHDWSLIISSLPDLRSLSFDKTNQPNLISLLLSSDATATFCRERLEHLTLAKTQLVTSSLPLLQRHFTSIRSLVLSSSSRASFSGLSLFDLEDAFDDPEIMPNLNKFSLSIYAGSMILPRFKWNREKQKPGDNYRQPKSG